MLASAVSAQDSYANVVSNSQDWKDVYSVMLYGQLEGISPVFLVSQRHGPILLNNIRSGSNLLIVSSEDVPQLVGYESVVEARDYQADEITFSNINLGLAAELDDITNYVIIDDRYGYNAVAAAPYAVVSNSYVLFANEDNIGEIDDFLSTRTVDSVLIFGQTDREVRSVLDVYNPEIINDNGDRFSNNVEITKRYQAINPSAQVILTNGEFIEKEVMSGSQPVLFIGNDNVPSVIADYIQDSDIQVGVLIGNELVGTATFIRRQVGISVFVKFAQGARQPQGSISQVEALDLFYLPVVSVSLDYDAIQYNRATGQLEVTYANNEDLVTYARGTFALSSTDGTQTVGDVDPVFIDAGEIKTVTYDVGSISTDQLSVDAFTIYGESPGSLERTLQESFCLTCDRQVDVVDVRDDCEIDLEGVEYRRPFFYVKTVNLVDQTCFVDLEIIDVIVAGERITYGLESIAELDPGETRELRVRAELEGEDLEDNERVLIRALYGARENSLIKQLEATFTLVLRGPDYITYALLGGILILILLIVLAVRRRRKR